MLSRTSFGLTGLAARGVLRPGRTDLGRLCASSTSAVEHKIVHRDAAGRRRSQSLASIAPPEPTLIGSPPILALRSEEHTSELQSLMRISYAVFCLKKKKKPTALH